MKQTWYIARVMVVLVSTAMSQDYYGTDSEDSALYPDNLNDNSNYYLLNLNGSLRSRMALNLMIADPGQSFVCSPISALLPLGKLAIGASGTCQQELLNTIGVNDLPDVKPSFTTLLGDLRRVSGVKLTVCSRIYVNKDNKLNDTFESNAKDIFKSSVKRINVNQPANVARRINTWVNKKTKGMIDNIITPKSITKDSSVILVNAVYFSGNWKTRFTKTEIRDFYTATATRKVPMMTRDGHYKYHKNDALDAQVVEIPYKGNHASFVIFLPNTKDGLALLLYKLKLAPDLMQTAMNKLTMQPVMLSIPKFTTTTEIDLKRAYADVGLKEMFKPETGLSGIVRNERLFVSEAIQKAVIEVNENGTLASAVSAIYTPWLQPKLDYVKVEANCPFYYFIRVKEENIFSGVYDYKNRWT